MVSQRRCNSQKQYKQIALAREERILTYVELILSESSLLEEPRPASSMSCKFDYVTWRDSTAN